eukprot:jgi/Picsp_1/3757/NSC_06592-R1_protein
MSRILSKASFSSLETCSGGAQYFRAFKRRELCNASSERRDMSMSSQGERLHMYSTSNEFATSFSRIPNARDLADSTNYIDRGKIFRSGNPIDATRQDSIVLRKSFGVEKFIDLRSGSEHEAHEEWHCILSGGTIYNYSFTKWDGIHLASSIVVGINPDLEGESLQPCELHRFSLLEKKRFISKLLWKLPLWNTILALSYKVMGYEDKMRSILLPEINALGLPLVYEVILETAKLELNAALHEILASVKNQQPVLIFCKLGKDRTGLLSALVLACCDVPLDDIVSDYTKSNDIHQIALGGVEKMKDVQGVDASLFSSAPREAMIQTFAYIDKKYGSVHEYLDDIGFSFLSQNELKQAMVGETKGEIENISK